MPKKRTTDVVRFGERLAILRKAAGLTQLTLSKRIGISRRMVAYYEVETVHPPTTILPRLALALGVSVDTLLNGTGKVGDQPVDPHLRQRLRILENLGASERRRAIRMIDEFIERDESGRQA